MTAWTNPAAGVLPTAPFVAFESYVKTVYPTYLNFSYSVNMSLGKVISIDVPGITQIQMNALIADLQLQFPLLF